MKRMATITKFWRVLLLVMLLATSIAAQSQSPQAMTWFKVGLTEKDPQKKIVAYLKAMEFDPQFVEALYNLGLTYKRQEDYRRAELYLIKALSVKPEKLKTETKLQILFELGTTYKKLGKINDAQEAFSSAKSLVMAPAMKAAIVLELGRLQYESGKYQAALVELHEGRNLPGANQEQFNSLIRQAENAVELQGLYDAAENARAGSNWRVAKALFEQIREKNPAYKDVAAKIAELDGLLNAETQKNNVAALYDQTVQQTAAGNLEAAVAGLESILQQSGGNYKDAKERLETARQQLAQQQQNERLENDYAAGVAALKSRNWARAILALEKVLAVDRNFRDARKRLNEAQNGLDRESNDTIITRYYAEGIDAMKKNEFGAARAAFEKVRKINPHYRETATLLAQMESAMQAESASARDPEIAAAVAAGANLDSLYQEAIAAGERRDWIQAVVNFEKVQLLQTNYRDVVNRLAEARANATLAAKSGNHVTTPADSTTSVYIGGAVALIVVPLLGLAVFSPATRARLHLIRGDYTAAVQIYENLLARHPARVKLYPALANLYLLQSRRDENAMKVYRTILQLNLVTNNRDEINSIVAQNYLTEGRTDSDAIAVLESALKAEQRRQPSR